MQPFAQRLLDWFDHHGRHDLPWQHPRTPYRVWVSEIMLQQTRVETVIPYFERFTARFPDVQSLAAAPVDDVLALWAGLGYYARARNLHRCARTIVEDHDGHFPRERVALEVLPGIGRSTAAAILAQAHDAPEAILDGNAKRVLARHAAVNGWPGSTTSQKTLWREAEARTPASRCADYTQAIMDLGALVCTRSRPDCAACPVAEDCGARLQDRTAELPHPRPKRQRPTRTRWAALLHAPEGIYLEQRPPSGIWGGLYTLPEAEDPEHLEAWVRSHWPRAEALAGDALSHGFSHYQLDLRVQRYRLPAGECGIMDAPGVIWYKPGQSRPAGIPAPIQGLLQSEKDSGHGTNR